MNDRQITNILKLLILGLQLAVVVILVFTGIRFKDTKEARELLKPVKDDPDSWSTKLDLRYFYLLVAIICSPIDTAITLASLFLNNHIVMRVAFVFKAAAAGSYLGLLTMEIAFSSPIEPMFGVPIAGLVINIFSSSITYFVFKRIMKAKM